jgi:hypothetical protein
MSSPDASTAPARVRSLAHVVSEVGDTFVGILTVAFAGAAIYAGRRSEWLAAGMGVFGGLLLLGSWSRVRLERVPRQRWRLLGVPRKRSRPLGSWRLTKGMVAGLVRGMAILVRIAGVALIGLGVLFLSEERSNLIPAVLDILIVSLGAMFYDAARSLQRDWDVAALHKLVAAVFFLPSLALVIAFSAWLPYGLWPLQPIAIAIALVCRGAYRVVAALLCHRLFSNESPPNGGFTKGK